MKTTDANSNGRSHEKEKKKNQFNAANQIRQTNELSDVRSSNIQDTLILPLAVYNTTRTKKSHIELIYPQSNSNANNLGK